MKRWMSCARQVPGKELPSYIQQNMNPNFELRPYQKEAFENFITYFEGKSAPESVSDFVPHGYGKRKDTDNGWADALPL
jgi:hypothetical protein